MTELELYHHGILGQKWGIRRFQKKDGSLTSAGRKRVKDLYQESRDDKQGKRPPAEDKTKVEELYAKVRPTSELTNEELEYAIRRVQLERAYNELYAPKTPEQKSFFQKLNESKDKISAVAGVLEGVAKVGAATLAVAKLFGYKTKSEKTKEAKEAAEKAKADAEKATKAARDTWEFEEKKKEAYRKQYAFEQGIKQKTEKAEQEKREAAESWASSRAEEARARARADSGRAEARAAANDFFNSSRTKSYANSGQQTASSFGDTFWDVPFRDVTGRPSGLSSPK